MNCVIIISSFSLLLRCKLKFQFSDTWGYSDEQEQQGWLSSTTSAGLGQLCAAYSARLTRRRQLGVGSIRRRANSTQAIRRQQTFRHSVSNCPYCPEFCSLPNKTAMIYHRFLDIILGLRANVNPESISRDYEIALFNTVSAGFPNAEIFGCFFSILWRTLRSVSTANI